MSMRPLLRVSTLVLATSLGSAAPALADAVTYWNITAVAAVTAGRPGPQGTLDLALIQAAVHDAVQAIEGDFQPYKVTAAGSGSPEAAAAGAAHRILVRLYGPPSPPANPVGDMVEAAWVAYLAANPGLVGNPGFDVGEDVADAMMAFYRMTPIVPAFRGCETFPPCDPGDWRPTPNHLPAGSAPPPAAMTTPWLGSITPFTMLFSAQFRAEPPPALTSRRYLRDYNEVKSLGAFESTAATELTRTAAETIQAYFWSENFVRQWNEVARNLAAARSLDISNNGRLLAFLNLVMADAAISAWDNKRHYNFWRPVTAIQEGDADGNPRTHGDPNWQSLINTPPYPDHTSGANSLSGAATRMLALFFGTDVMEFTVMSLAPQLGAPADPAMNPNRRRTFHRFSDAAQEVVDARVLLGIHFRFADEAARLGGEKIARWAFERYLQRVKRFEQDN